MSARPHLSIALYRFAAGVVAGLLVVILFWLALGDRVMATTGHHQAGAQPVAGQQAAGQTMDLTGLATSRPIEPMASTYVVMAGDTLWAIAGETKPDGVVRGEWVAIIKSANGLDNDQIFPGQALRIPDDRLDQAPVEAPATPIFAPGTVLVRDPATDTATCAGISDSCRGQPAGLGGDGQPLMGIDTPIIAQGPAS